MKKHKIWMWVAWISTVIVVVTFVAGIYLTLTGHFNHERTRLDIGIWFLLDSFILFFPMSWAWSRALKTGTKRLREMASQVAARTVEQ